MNGFSLLLRKRPNIAFTSMGDCKRVIDSTFFLAYNNMLNKFEQDKVFYENEKYILILDGVCVNRCKLLKNCKGCSKDDWALYLISKYESSDLFFNELRGSFCGAIYDKIKDRSIIFSDQIGSKFLYYAASKDAFVVSSQMADIYAFFRQNNIVYNISVENAYLLLSYGYMLEDRTLCEQAHKLEPGYYIVYEQGKISIKEYYRVDNTPYSSIKEAEAIELMDSEFRRAIQLQFDHDVECGYNKHLVNLSGGLDSRMVCWVAHEMGYTEQLNITFSQTGYLDETVPQQIASDLSHEWIFKSLDGGWWLRDVDEITKSTAGEGMYWNHAHANNLAKYMSFDSPLGMRHSGQLGDVIYGSSYCTSLDRNVTYDLCKDVYTKQYVEYVRNIKFHQDYGNEELQRLYYRGFRGINRNSVLDSNKLEDTSPFTDIDLMEKVLKIPLSLRFKHKLYKKWIIEKYPQAANYVWESLGYRINRKYGFIHLGDKTIPIEQLPTKVLNRLKGTILTDTPKSMNPVGYYMKTNQILMDFINNYFDENLDRVVDKDLRNTILEIKQNKDAWGKVQAISLLSALKLFY